MRFVNDSRATSLAATRAALATLAEGGDAGRIQLILGGILKGGRFADLEPRLGAVGRIYAIGAATRAIRADIRSVPVTACKGLDDAVERAFRAAKRRRGGIVLLSPGCSSFDLFDSYRHRGRRFVAAAARLGAAEGAS